MRAKQLAERRRRNQQIAQQDAANRCAECRCDLTREPTVITYFGRPEKYCQRCAAAGSWWTAAIKYRREGRGLKVATEPEKHTPGPWEVVLRIGGANGAAIVSASGRVVARVPHTADRPYYQKEADLHVLAAAPDLLAALKVLMDGVNEIWKTESPAFMAAVAAIAKAEGR